MHVLGGSSPEYIVDYDAHFDTGVVITVLFSLKSFLEKTVLEVLPGGHRTDF
jgi:hypothetical protein